VSSSWHPSFHTLLIGCNAITDIGARHISQLIYRSNTIREVNLSTKWPSLVDNGADSYQLHPHITHIGAHYIAREIQKKSALTSLSLANQRIGDHGSIHLFKALNKCYLRVLNLQSNELSDECCEALRVSLEDEHTVLESIILAYNRISDDGGVAIAFGLARNTSLKLMDLSDNQLGHVGLDALYLCLQYNHTLESLITINNSCSTDDDRAELLVKTRRESNAFDYDPLVPKPIFGERKVVDSEVFPMGSPASRPITVSGSAVDKSVADTTAIIRPITMPNIEIQVRCFDLILHGVD